jgi:hypothetical protein
MEKRDLIESEVKKTLNSLDGISRAEVNPFLYTKIINKMEEADTVERRFNFKIALGVVIVCIIINLAAYLYIPQYTDSVYYTREYQIKSFASEYSSINNFYFY